MLGKQLGVIRRVDVLGRIVLPKEIVDTLAWNGKMLSYKQDGSSVIVTLINDGSEGRKIDPLGRIVVPKRIRMDLGIEYDTQVEMFFYQHGIVLRKYENSQNE